VTLCEQAMYKLQVLRNANKLMVWSYNRVVRTVRSREQRSLNNSTGWAVEPRMRGVQFGLNLFCTAIMPISAFTALVSVAAFMPDYLPDGKQQGTTPVKR
jgi:hypothetical protein